MDIVAIVNLIGARLAAGAIFLGVPVALIGIARYGIRQVAEPEYVEIPLLIKLTVTAGLILGVGLLPRRPIACQVSRIVYSWRGITKSRSCTTPAPSGTIAVKSVQSEQLTPLTKGQRPDRR